MSEHEIVAPDGSVHRVKSLRQFCREHGLDSGNLCQVVWGSRRHHKGYTCPAAGYVRTYIRSAP